MSRPRGKASTANTLFADALRQHHLGNIPGAVALYLEALKKCPSAEIYANLGVALQLQGHLEAAVIAYQKALRLEPQHMPTLSNLGGALRMLGRTEEALPILNQAIIANPDSADAYYNLGLTFGDKQQPDQAITAFEEAFRIDPRRKDAQFDRAICLLQKGDLIRGFEAYECRFKYDPKLAKPYPKPFWDGGPLNGRTLLLQTEQGFGDTLQFIRYVTQIPKGPNDRIILDCPKPLKLLLQSFPGIDQVIAHGNALPAFDVRISLLSLPHLFKTTLDTIPADCPYIMPPHKSGRLGLSQVQQLKIGIVWASGQSDVGVRRRKIPLAQWLPLLELSGVQFYSLQKGPSAKELETQGFSGLIENLDSQIHDFADTAAILNELDLIISTDTAIVHLAGAMNKPVWVLLPHAAEWRWLLDRQDSPWYPSLRLFRKSTPSSDWQDVIADVKASLTQWLPLLEPLGT